MLNTTSFYFFAQVDYDCTVKLMVNLGKLGG